MSDLTVSLSSIPETLLLPLWGRAELSKIDNPILVDKNAIAIISRLQYDFTKIKADLNPSKNLTWLARARQFDDVIKRYVASHPRATCVNLGAGLDTTFSRVDNGTIKWFDLDLPDVIDIRKRLIPETDRSTCIPCSVFDLSWKGKIPMTRDGLIFMAGGLLFYFKEDEVKGLLTAMAPRYPGAEFVLDAMSPTGIKQANKMLMRVGMGQAIMKWGLKKAKVMETWSPAIKVAAQFDYFRGLDVSWLSWKPRIMALANRLMGIMTIVRVTFRA